MKADKVPLTRSQLMARVRGRGNKSTEERLATLLRKAGVTGWRRHSRLPGTPDFAFPKLRFAIFVDGCFWHGCPRCYTKPKTNREFWDKKVRDNRARDRRVSRELRASGWLVMRIWAHELKRNETVVLARIIHAILTREPASPAQANLPKEFMDAHFRAEEPPGGWPNRFGIVTAYNPDGIVRSAAENRAADASLSRRLRSLGFDPFRVTGGSKDFKHAEPGWGFEILRPEIAIWLGRVFRQLAVYYVQCSKLLLIACESTDKPLFVDDWKGRLSPDSKLANVGGAKELT